MSVNDFLLKQSGAAGQSIDKLLADKPENYGPVFFQPYTSVGNFAKRAAYVVSAPIFLSVFALEFAALSLVEGIKSVFSLITMDFSGALAQAKLMLIGSIFSAILLLTAAVSPLVNAVDLVGSLFAKSEPVSGNNTVERGPVENKQDQAQAQESSSTASTEEESSDHEEVSGLSLRPA